MLKGEFEQTHRLRKGLRRLRPVPLRPRPQDQVECIRIARAFPRAAPGLDIRQAYRKRGAEADENIGAILLEADGPIFSVS